MSNDLVAIMQNNPSIVGTGLDADTAAVAGGMAGGSKRISIKGGVFRMMVNGKEQAVNEDRSMSVVLVKMAHNASRTWYAKAYREGDKASPACWSPDSKTPDPAVKEPPLLLVTPAPILLKVLVRVVQVRRVVCHGERQLFCRGSWMGMCISWCFPLRPRLVRKTMDAGLFGLMFRCLLHTT
jgi:hypothetical protein